MADGVTNGSNVVCVDVADGTKRVMNNKKLYVKLLTKFRDDTKLDDLEAALAAGDMEKGQEMVHTLKGVSANLSLSELFKQSLELENQIKARSVNPLQMETVKTVFTVTMQEIHRIITENA